MDPLVRGICAGNARELSVHFIASYLHEKEQADGCFIKVILFFLFNAATIVFCIIYSPAGSYGNNLADP